MKTHQKSNFIFQPEFFLLTACLILNLLIVIFSQSKTNHSNRNHHISENTIGYTLDQDSNKHQN